MEQLNDDDGELLEMVNGEIVNEEMKRRAISDLEFEKYIKQFECSNVPDLVNAIFDESTHIGEKFPFLYDISSIFDNYILDPKKYSFCEPASKYFKQNNDGNS